MAACRGACRARTLFAFAGPATIVSGSSVPRRPFAATDAWHAFMLTAPSPTSVALLLGLSFFSGLAFEDFFARAAQKRPGGIRTFPMLALAGGMLYLLDPTHGIAFTAGLLVLGAWLIMYYRTHLAEPDETGETKASLIVPLLNVHAYLLGAVALALPPWVAVTTTVVAVLLLDRPHLAARPGAADRHEGDRHRRPVSDPDRDHPAAAAERAGDDADRHHAAPGLAGAGRGLHVFLCQLSGAALLGRRGRRIVDGGVGRPLLVHRDDGGAGAAGESRSRGPPPCPGRHHARHRDHVSSHPGDHRHLQHDAGAPLGAAADRAIGGGTADLRAAILGLWQSPADDQPAPQEPAKLASSRNPLELGAAIIFAVLFVVTSFLSTWATNAVRRRPASIRSRPSSAFPISIRSSSIWRKAD